MTVYTIGFSVPKSMISPTDWAMMLSALPNGYQLTGRAGNRVFVNLSGGSETHCGTVCVVDGEVRFEASNDNFGEWLIRRLKEKYPEANPERILWAVFVDLYGKWSMISQPMMDKEAVLKQVDYFHLEKKPVLCSFRAIDLSDEGVMTITTQKIFDDWQVTDIDEGPQLLLLTNLESASILPEFVRPNDYLSRLE